MISSDSLDDEVLAEEVRQQEQYEHYRIVADPGQTLMRVDRFLIEHMPNTSRSRIQKAAEAGCIQCNGVAVKSNYRVKPADVVTLVLDRPHHETAITPEDLPLNVVYEDEEVMVVDKAAGVVVHPGCGNYHGTLIHAIAWHLKDDPRFDPNDAEVGLCHHIDKDTSGLLVVAKTPEAKASLCKQFFDKTTRREYNALVWGSFSEESGTVRGKIGRNPSNRLQMAIVPEDSELGKPAVTHYKVLERLGYVSWIACRLETGRTHQIRVHMKSIGHTLFADTVYGGDEILRGERTAKYKQFIANCFDICPRQALHARTLGFRHPMSGEEVFFESPLPADMSRLLERWRSLVKS